MQVAVRSYLTAGVVTVGAAAIVLSPIAPTMPDVHLPSVRDAQVQLSAAAGPIETWLAVITQTVDNIGTIGDQIAADPAPILSQVLVNQLANASTLAHASQETITGLITAVQGLPATIQTATGLLLAGDVIGAANTLLAPLLTDALGIIQGPVDAFGVVTTTAQNITNFLNQVPGLVLSLGIPVLGPVYSVVNAMAATAQAVVDDGGTGDFGGIVNALVNAPATLTGALLNGYGDGPLGSALPAAGLLTPADGPLGALGAGPIAALLAFRDTFAAAIKPVTVTPEAAIKSLATSDVAALPKGGATVTLATGSAKPAKVTPEVKSAAAPADATDATGAADTDTAPTTPTKAKHRASVDNPVSSAIKKAVGADKTHKSTSGKSSSK